MKYKTCFEHGVKYKESCPVCDVDKLFKTEMQFNSGWALGDEWKKQGKRTIPVWGDEK